MGTSDIGKENEPELSRIDSFDQTYARFHQAIYANVFKIVRNHSAAEDLLQDVFIAFWENMRSLEPERIPNWLFVVSFNKSISYIKKAGKINTGPYPMQSDTPEHMPETDEAEFEEKLLQVYEAIELLPEKKKQIFKQHRIEGKRLEQIASEMELSIHTVKDHLKIAGKLVRKSVLQNSSLRTEMELALLFVLSIY